MQQNLKMNKNQYFKQDKSNIQEHPNMQTIPWNVDEEGSLFCDESFRILWELELGGSMNSYYESNTITRYELECPKPDVTKNKDTKILNTSYNKSSQRRLISSEYEYVDFSSAIECFSTNYPDNFDFDEIVGERLEAIMLYGGAKSKDDVVLLRDVAHHKSLMEVTDHKQLTFVNKLMQLLTDNPDPTVITWLPHGRSFIVRDKDRFVSDILPMYFASTLYKSFQRQLNMWGFQRISGSIDKGAYYHQLFLRGIPRLSNLMERKDSMSFSRFNKGNVRKRKGRPLSNPELEPDFHKLSRLRPIP